MAKQTLAHLRNYLQTLHPGPVADVKSLRSVLQSAWEELAGSSAEKTEDWKLARMKEVKWQPPVVSFVLERHGATVKGSIYADLHEWSVDIQKGTADCRRGRKRRLGKQKPRLDVTPLAQRVIQAVQCGGDDPALKRLKDGQVRVLVGELVPNNAALQTIAGRRKRLSKAIEEGMAVIGWVRVEGRMHIYACAQRPR